MATLLGGASAIILPRMVSRASSDSRTAESSNSSADNSRLTETPATSGESIPEVDEPENSLPKFRPEQLIGRWLREGKIRRDVVMKPGGTATMKVTLDYLSSLLYGREMELELAWSLEDDILTYSIVEGTPKANVDRVIRDFGNSISYRVVKADPDEIVLKEDDGTDHLQSWKAIR